MNTAYEIQKEAGDNIPRARWLRVIPPILIVCILSYMDRVNIAFAVPGGMGSELGITASMAGLAGGIFFIGYLFLQIPGGKIAVHGSGKKFIAWSLVAWAILSVGTGLVKSDTQLLILRFLLGVSEGGMLPVVLTMVSNWFPDKERGRANASVILFVPIAGMITAPLSGFILGGLGWRYLFIIEGGLTLFFLVFWLWFASDRPDNAKWLSAAEKNFILTSLKQERESASGSEVKAASFREVLSNPTIWQLIALNFFYQAGIYGYTLWLPTLLKSLTQGGMEKVGVLAIFPYVGTMLGMILNSALSDKLGKRKLFVATPLAGFAVCLFLSVTFKDQIWVSYAFLIGCGFFLQAAAGVFWTIPSKLLSPEAAGSARGLINALGNLGGFCGPYAVGVLIQSSGQGTGVYALCGSLILATLIACTLPKRAG